MHISISLGSRMHELTNNFGCTSIKLEKLLNLLQKIALLIDYRLTEPAVVIILVTMYGAKERGTPQSRKATLRCEIYITSAVNPACLSSDTEY